MSCYDCVIPLLPTSWPHSEEVMGIIQLKRNQVYMQLQVLALCVPASPSNRKMVSLPVDQREAFGGTVSPTVCVVLSFSVSCLKG